MTESSETRRLELSVRDFGPISEANIDLRPMTVFVGPSNTGKSYLAILIYALHGFFAGRVTVAQPGRGAEFGEYAAPLFRRSLPGDETISSNHIEALVDWLDETLSVMRSDVPQTGSSPAMPESVSGLISSRFRDIREQRRLLDYEIARCFGISESSELVRYGVEDGTTVSVRIPAYVKGELPESFGYDFTIRKGVFDLHALVPDLATLWFDPEGVGWSHLTFDQGLRWLSNQVRADERTDRRQRLASLLLDGLAEALGSRGFEPLTRLGYYLPADRAGIMNSYRVIVDSVIRQTSQPASLGGAPRPTLSGILSDFLLRLATLGDVRRVDLDGDLAANIEMSLLQGRVLSQRAEVGYPEFLYRPNDWTRDLRLMNTSSMVSELTPVVLFLRHVVGPGEVLIIEEPEAHLHPAMQIEFVRHLAAAVRAGIRVIITTHSEWVLEELANLVHLSDLPESQRDGIGGADTALTPDQLGIWLFGPDKESGGSIVEEIRFSAEDGGFVTDYEDVAIRTHNDWARISNRLTEIDAE